MQLSHSFLCSNPLPSGDGACHPGHAPLGHGCSDSSGLPASLLGLGGGDGGGRRWTQERRPGRAALHPAAAQWHPGCHVCLWLPLPGGPTLTCCCSITELCTEGPGHQGPRSAGCHRGDTGRALPDRPGESTGSVWAPINSAWVWRSVWMLE